MTRCIARLNLCIPQHDDQGYLMTVYDQRGELVDISEAQEITFIIATNVGGTILLTKTLTGGGITLNNAHQFNFAISSAQSGAMTAGEYYCEVQIINSVGDQKTVGAGKFTVDDTRIGD